MHKPILPDLNPAVMAGKVKMIASSKETHYLSRKSLKCASV